MDILAPFKTVHLKRRVQELEQERAGLTTKLENFHASESSHQKALQAAKEKERELTESLNIAAAQKKKSDDALKDSNKRILDTENLLKVLRNERDATQEEFRNIEDELKAAGLKETELMEKLKSAESQVEQQAKLIEEGKLRTTELESQNQTIIKDSELRYQELMAKFSNRDLEAKSLLEKLKLLEDRIQKHEQEAAESAHKNAIMMEELQQGSKKLSALGGLNEELLVKVLVEINTELKDTVNELQKLLESATAQEEATAGKLAFHTSTINELQEKLSQHETHNRSLAEVNKKLTDELAESELKLNDIREKLSVAISEKENAVEEQCSSKKEIEDLNMQLCTERHRLESELSTITEEKNQLHEAYMEAKKGHESVIAQLEERMEAYKLKEESLNAEIKKRSSSEPKLKELEEQLHSAEAQLKKAKSVQAKATSRVENLTSQIEDYKLKVNEIHTLNEKVQQLEQELQLAKKYKMKKGYLLPQFFTNRVRNLYKGLCNLPNNNQGRLLWNQGRLLWKRK